MARSNLAFGRYELVEELGFGGFAMVYRAWDPGLRRDVALKALFPHLARDPELRDRFLSEAQALARLQHPGIVTVHDVGEADGRPFFAMAFVEGRTLAQMLSANQRLSLEQTLPILRSLASALDYLHASGLVHRDVKPENIILQDSGRVVLMDLGIVRSLDATSLTRTGASLGTPSYMAPEQVRGEHVGPAADIYALGILTYHLLAGRPPFIGDTASILHAQVYEPPAQLRQLDPGLPDSVYAAVDLALAKEPSWRPNSSGEFVAVLEGTAAAAAHPTDPRLTLTEAAWEAGADETSVTFAPPSEVAGSEIAPLVLANRWARVGAASLDWLMAWLLLGLDFIPLGLFAAKTVQARSTRAPGIVSDIAVLAWFLLSLFIPAAYFTLGFWANWTVGGKLCRLFIADHRNRRLGLLQAAVRSAPAFAVPFWLLQYAVVALLVLLLHSQATAPVFLSVPVFGFISIVELAIVVVGYLWMLWDAKQQTLWDKLAGTIVVRARR